MRVLITGGSGFLGTAISRELLLQGAEVTSLSHSRAGREGSILFIPYDALHDIPPQDIVLNFAGENVAGRWTARKKRSIYHSRLDTTRTIAEWITQCEQKPQVFLSGSAVGIYGDADDEDLTEDSNVSLRKGFLAKVCRDWEQAAAPAAWSGVRTVLLRTGQALHPSGGFLGVALPLLRRFPIVVLGSRKAWFPWISLSDWTRLTLYAIAKDTISGPLNLVGPVPVTAEEYTSAVAAKLGKRVWGRIPERLLTLALGEFGEAIAASQKVLPAKALGSGFEFEHPSLADYLAGLSF